ncbi:hypothetical protein [Nocardia veterana]|uniref:Uncharacterized protein n=1 Tax=Nocardia veterana TaxID=132249 RepID=A0A7X6M273_9NOCA|nr:hypothetical protein [Nocardia veterana]NKY88903.1 hypothetical protein [Nocardia veterana]
MSRSKDDTAALHDALVQAYGPDFDIDSFTPDLSAAPVEVEQLTDPSELMMTRTVTLQLPWPVMQRLEARAAQAGESIDALVSEWVAVEAAADDTVPRDAILHVLAQRFRRTA